MKRPAVIAVGLAAWLVGMPVAHGVAPWLVATAGPRYSGAWSWLGLVLLSLGALWLGWVFVTGFASLARLPAESSVDWRPKVFLAEGPYAHTRNPMYVGELAVWLGWALWLGSPLVLLAALLLFIGMQRIVRREERDLATQFGDAYRRYAAAVPRWILR